MHDIVTPMVLNNSQYCYLVLIMKTEITSAFVPLSIHTASRFDVSMSVRPSLTVSRLLLLGNARHLSSMEVP